MFFFCIMDLFFHDSFLQDCILHPLTYTLFPAEHLCCTLLLPLVIYAATSNSCCTLFPPPIVHAAHYFHCLWRLVLFTNANSLSIYRRIRERRTSSGIGRGASGIGGGTPNGIGSGTPSGIGRGTTGIGRDMVLFT